MRKICLEETASTNDYIKKFLPLGEDVIVCAKRQTGGKGTKGRSFSSKEGGVYLSALTFPEKLPAKEAFLVMAHAAVAVCKTAEHYALHPEIKWSNDVLLSGKKLAGILIENELSGGFVKASVVGIGMNVENSLLGLENIAVRLKDLLPTPPSCEEARDLLIENYLKESSFDDYLARIRFLGREVLVTEGDRRYSALAKAVLPDGRLLIEEGGRERRLSAAEIAIGI